MNLNDVYLVSQISAALDEDEKTQFFFFTGQYYQAFSNMYDLWQDGLQSQSAQHEEAER